MEFVIIALLVYMILSEYRVKRVRDEFFNKGGGLLKSAECFIRKVFKGVGFERIDKKLRGVGRPFGLIPETYILIKIGMTLLAVFYVCVVDMEILQAVLFIIIAFYGIDLYIRQRKKVIEDAFKNEMPEIVDVFEVCAVSGISLEDTFGLANEFSEEREVKQELEKLSEEYSITKDKEICLRRFSRNVKLPEVSILRMALLQGDRTGKTQDILESLSSSINNTAISKIVRQDKGINYKVLAAVYVLMVTTFILYMYPYFTSIQGGLQLIF